MKKIGCITFFLFIILQVFSQRITIDVDNQSLSKVLQTLEKNYQYKFAYDNQQTDSVFITKKIQVNKIEEMLQLLLVGTNLIYSNVKDVYIIKPDTKKQTKLTGIIIPNLNTKISGLVKDKKTGENLPYASILVKGLNIGTLANSDGYFTMLLNNNDSVEIVVSFIGYMEKRVKIKPAQNQLLHIIELDVQVNEMQTAVVTHNACQMFEIDKEAGSITLNTSKICDMPAIAEQDIVTPLQLMPGVDGTTESASGLIIRKSISDQNMILFDGMTIFQIDHFYGMISSFNSKAIKDIQLFKSGFDAQYGGYTSGLVEVTGKSGNMNQTSVNGSIDMWSADGMIEVPIIKQKLSLMITGRRSYTDLYQSPLYDKLFNNIRYDLQNYYEPEASLSAFSSNSALPTLYFFDLTGKLTYKPTENDVISLSTYRGSDYLDFLSPYSTLTNRTSNPYIKESTALSNQGVSLRWARKWSDQFFQTFQAGVSAYSSLINHVDTSNILSLSLGSYSEKNIYNFKNTISNVNFNLHNQYQLNNFTIVAFGISTNYYQTLINETRHQIGDTSYNVNTSTYNVQQAGLYSAYLQTNFSYGNLTSLKIGLRGNYYSLLNDYRFEPRLSGIYRLTPSLRVKLVTGIYYQFVNRYSNPGDFRNQWVLSDKNVYPIVGCFNNMIGFNYDLTPTLNIDCEFYYKQTWGILYDSIAYSKPASVDSFYIVNTQHYYTYMTQNVFGMDLLIRETIGNYQAWIAYTLSKAYCNSIYLNNGKNFPDDNDQRHEFKFFNSMSIKRWDFSLSWILGSGKTWNYYQLNSNLEYLPYHINSERLQLYHRMDIGAHYNIYIHKLAMRFGMNIFNVYNHNNMLNSIMKLKDDKPGLDAITGVSPLQVVDLYGLGFTPNFFIDIKF